jgi:hypothetical protein
MRVHRNKGTESSSAVNVFFINAFQDLTSTPPYLGPELTPARTGVGGQNQNNNQKGTTTGEKCTALTRQ